MNILSKKILVLGLLLLALGGCSSLSQKNDEATPEDDQTKENKDVETEKDSEAAKDPGNHGGSESDIVLEDEYGNVLDSDDYVLKPKDPDKSISTDMDTSTWKVYENAEAGIRFKYPEQFRLTEGRELAGTDKGKFLGVGLFEEESSFAISFNFASEDFDPGAGEGCCFYYRGAPLDISLPDAQLEEVLEKELDEVYQPAKGEIDGRGAVRFVRKNMYIESWLTDSMLIGLENPVYKNVLISGLELKRFAPEVTEEEISAYVSSENFTLTEEDIKKVDLFNAVLSTVEFI